MRTRTLTVVEKWFTLDSLLDESSGGGITVSAALAPSALSRVASKRASHATRSAGGDHPRTPSVLLEFSFSRPETLDE